ncbi:MAG: hypothetical protein H6629_07480 [Calditrichae bacterium]|nr:hypothetical protein [Calditrichia bacterium]
MPAHRLLGELQRADRQVDSISRSQWIPSAEKPEKIDHQQTGDYQHAFYFSVFIIAVVLWSRFTGRTSDLPDYAQQLNSIAVLPFDDLSPEQDQEYFCATADRGEIFTKLARLGELKVIARTSVMRYRNKIVSEKAFGKLGRNWMCLPCWKAAFANMRITSA